MRIPRILIAIFSAILSLGAAQAQQLRDADGGSATYKQFADGLFVRERLAPQRSGDVVISVWDLNVGPGRRSAPVKLPGGAVMDVRLGQGVLLIDREEKIDLKPGAAASVDEGRTIQFDNSAGTGPLAIRVTLIRFSDN
jgi:hypothetical protein